MLDKETMMRRNANNVTWVKQHRFQVLPNVILAMLEHLAKRKVFVQHARMVFIKATKAKQNALNAHWENHTSMTKQCVVLATKVHLVVAVVIVRSTHLDLTKTAKEQQHAILLFHAHLKKYPMTNAPDVNCHRGVPAKWANI